MNKKIEIWILKAEQIYNHFNTRKNLNIWEELFNEVSFDNLLFFEWRNQFLLYLNKHPFLSSMVYQSINQTFHIKEDYYVLVPEEKIKNPVHNRTGHGDYSFLSKEIEEQKENIRQYGNKKEQKEFIHIISVMQEENIYVSEALLYDNLLFDIDRMEPAADLADDSGADEYIYEYLNIIGDSYKSKKYTNQKKISQKYINQKYINQKKINREKNGRFSGTVEYRQSIESYYKNLLALSRYGYTSIYEKQQFMWLFCWFGDLGKSRIIAEDILQKEPQNLYAASYQIYLQAKQEIIQKQEIMQKISAESIDVLDRQTNPCRVMIKTAIAFYEMQQGNFQNVISILENLLDYSQMSFLYNFSNQTIYYTPDFWKFQLGRKISAYQAIVLCGGRMAYQDSYKLLRKAYQFLLEEYSVNIENDFSISIQKSASNNSFDKFSSNQVSNSFDEFSSEPKLVLFMAKAYLYTGEYKQAYNIIYNQKNKQIMIQNKCQTEYFIVMGDVLFARGDYRECMKTAENLDRILSKNKSVLCGKWGKTVYNKILCHNLYLLAQCSLLEKNYENACFYSECLMEEDFTAVQVYVIYLKACFFLYKLDKVKQTYDKIHFLFDEWEAGYYAEQAVLRQKSLWQDRKVLYTFENQNEPLFWYDSAMCLEMAGEDEAALQIYQKILKEYGVYADICIKISKYYQKRYFLHTFSLKDKNTALEYLQKQEENEDIPPYFELAEYYYQLTKYNDAIEVYLKNQKKIPELYYQRGYELMGKCFQRIYRFETAEKYFREAFSWKPERAEMCFETAEALKECKEYKKAIWWHQMAVQKFGEIYDRGYEAIGDLYLLLEKPKSALAYYYIQWVFACDKTETDRNRGEWLKMRYYKRMIHFYLTAGCEETAYEWAEQGINELSIALYRAELTMFYAEALMYKGVEPALRVMEECIKKEKNELAAGKNYKVLLEMTARYISYYFLTGNRKELKNYAEKFHTFFLTAYPQAKIEDYAEVKREGPKRYGEIGWYYLALGKEEFAQECFKKQWSMKPCIGCRSRSGCYRGYLNIARYYEAVKKYNHAIYFYKELLSQRHLPNHAEAKEALKRFQKIPKAERGEEFGK